MKSLKRISVWIYIALIIMVLLVIFDIVADNKDDSGWEEMPCLEGMPCWGKIPKNSLHSDNT